MTSLALIGASATLLALLVLAFRPSTPASIPDTAIVRVLSCCHWCLHRDLVRVRTMLFCADCVRPVCARHAESCAICARTTCLACCETWSGLDGVACGECQRRVS
jgi:hypothetical protein